ncbi:MAG: hypothetical protein ABJL17_02720 [Parvibaculum sp.]|uniref:hypothetical protein n=1 Tax=Alphaproteobacteria TaxID=28211 RepID=UPI0032676615
MTFAFVVPFLFGLISWSFSNNPEARTEAIHFAYRWQSLLAGIVGFIAAVLVVHLTLRSEKRTRDHERQALRVATYSELRQLAHHAKEAFEEIEPMLAAGRSATIFHLENSIRFVPPVIFQANAARIGLLGEEVHDLIHFHNCLSVLNTGIARMRRDIGDGEIGLENTKHVCDALLAILLSSAEAVAYNHGQTTWERNFDEKFPKIVKTIAEKYDAKYQADDSGTQN